MPTARINDVAAALTEPHTIARDLLVETEHPRYGTVRQVASPVRVGSEPPTYRRAPLRNEDAGRILGEMLGYDAAAVADLDGPGRLRMTVYAPTSPRGPSACAASDVPATWPRPPGGTCWTGWVRRSPRPAPAPPARRSPSRPGSAARPRRPCSAGA